MVVTHDDDIVAVVSVFGDDLLHLSYQWAGSIINLRASRPELIKHLWSDAVGANENRPAANIGDLLDRMDILFREFFHHLGVMDQWTKRLHRTVDFFSEIDGLI